MQKRISILIDGSNFYFKLKDLSLQDQLKLDFSEFCKFLTQSDTLIGCTYYIGAVKTDGTRKMDKFHANQQKLFTHLKSHGIGYTLGYLMKTNGKLHEKGVDVNVAVDILTNAYENKIDKFIIVSSDTDLIPAIKQALKLKKEVEYVGFSHFPSTAMVAVCSSSRLLTQTDLATFIL